jgi:branched-chain amino acid transport system permease protein
MRCATPRGNLALALAAIAIACMPLYASPYHMQLATTAMIAAMFALSLQLLAGGAGMVSLAQAAFLGLGAYTIHLLGRLLGGPPSILLSLPASVMVAGLAAFIIGPFALRTRGFFFVMTTLAFGQMLFFVFHDTPIGGGADGVFIQRPVFGAFGVDFKLTLANRTSVLLVTSVVVLSAMYGLLWWLMRTLFGHALLGIRANEDRMRAMGHDVLRLKLAAFVLAGALAGIAGHMAALNDAFVNPELLGWHRSAEALLIVLLGGIGALHGPILGAFTYTLIGEIGQSITERQRLVEGLVILAAVLLLRHGIAGLRFRRTAPT